MPGSVDQQRPDRQFPFAWLVSWFVGSLVSSYGLVDLSQPHKNLRSFSENQAASQGVKSQDDAIARSSNVVTPRTMVWKRYPPCQGLWSHQCCNRRSVLFWLVRWSVVFGWLLRSTVWQWPPKTHKMVWQSRVVHTKCWHILPSWTVFPWTMASNTIHAVVCGTPGTCEDSFSWFVVLVGCLARMAAKTHNVCLAFCPILRGTELSLSLVFRAQRTLALNVIHARVRGTPGTCEDFVPRCGEREFLARKAFASLSISHARRATNTVLVVATDHDVETIYSMTWDRWQRGSRRGLPLSVCGFIGDLTLAVECRATKNQHYPTKQSVK